MSNNNELENKLLEYEQWALTLGGYSPSTTERAIRRMRFMSKKINVLNPDQREILKFFSREVKNGKKASALNDTAKDLRSWFRFLHIDVQVPHFKEPPAPEPFIPSDEEVRKIINTAGSYKNKAIASRNKAIMEILFQGGIRIGELVRINIEDVSDDGIKIRSEKNEAPRIISLTDSAMRNLNDYIKYYRPATDASALFTTTHGRMTYQYLRNTIKEIAKEAGAPKFHAHSARHYCATALLRAGVDIRRVQTYLGHRSLRSTQRYTHLSNMEVAKDMKIKLEELFREDQSLNKKVQKMPEPAHILNGAGRV
ncbi:MAG: tyrosine-type recombinase/integrase [Ferroplasma sp.]|uniref:tyrosine-type recombinase/integrase n=1 Tax=Ferroplasma sp. TaxID=2591003 RepID=UPI0028156EED|nr:tyrosine-type recombinase/integrase [Ferroplasma sp.]WMT51831.1 MAG: tyrosine-type recombinase/integrase [Ferroplasma sp.]